MYGVIYIRSIFCNPCSFVTAVACVSVCMYVTRACTYSNTLTRTLTHIHAYKCIHSLLLKTHTHTHTHTRTHHTHERKHLNAHYPKLSSKFGAAARIAVTRHINSLTITFCPPPSIHTLGTPNCPPIKTRGGGNQD